jgi:hypothetical protein
MKATIYPLLGTLGVTVALLSGCAATLVQDAIEIDLPDGRTVTCVFSDGGGTSCDWANAQ